MNKFEQGLLRYLSPQQLRRIRSKKIGIGGCGGLGSNVAAALCRSGFRDFEILDCDAIDASNLNRQYYFLNEIGKSKAEILKKRLLKINPGIRVKTHRRRWTRQNGATFFKDCDVIVEAFDKAEDKHAFVEFYRDKTSFLVGGSGMAGLGVKKRLSVKCVGNVFIVGDQASDTAFGHPPMAPRVTACAGLMAEIILDKSLSGKF